MRVDTVIKNTIIINAHGPAVKGGVAIKDGLITSIGDDAVLPDGDRVIDGRGLFMLPGLVDPHVHLGYWGDFPSEVRSETLGAALGGVTTILLMLKLKNLPRRLSESPSYLEIFEEVKQIIETTSVVNVALRPYPMTERQIEEIEAMAEYAGVRTAKFAMTLTRGSPEADMAGAFALSAGDFLEALRRVARVGGVACIHAENQEIIDWCANRLMKNGRSDLGAWAESRPNVSEVEAIRRASFLAAVSDCPVYFAHVTTPEGLEFLGEEQSRGKKIFAEACPHYLVLSKDTPGLGKLGKQKPPLRDQRTQEALWHAIRSGVITCVGSDHMAAVRQDREAEDIWSCQWGFPSIETLLPILISEGVNKRTIPLSKIVELCSYKPAKLFGLYPRKGTISVGSDADLFLLDVNKVIRVRPNFFPSRSDFSLYDGWDLQGWPVLTMVRGRLVVEDGQLLGTPGTGRYIFQSAAELDL